MTREIPLWKQMESEYQDHVGNLGGADPSKEYGRQHYESNSSFSDSLVLSHDFLAEIAKEMRNESQCIGKELLRLYGYLAGYLDQVICHRDTDALVTLLSVAQESQDLETELALTANEAVVDAMGETIWYLTTGEDAPATLRPHTAQNIETIRGYYTIEGGLQKRVHNRELFERLSEWPNELHAYWIEGEFVDNPTT